MLEEVVLADSLAELLGELIHRSRRSERQYDRVLAPPDAAASVESSSPQLYAE